MARSGLFTFIVILIIDIQIGLTVPTSNSLQQVHVIFRHGDRTPDALSFYPNDPHKNDLWHPYGLGQLTNLLGFPIMNRNCTNYKQEFIKSQSSEEVQNYFRQNREKIEYINEKSGLKIKTVIDLFILYFGLYSEEHTNRTLPEWTKSIYPEFLEDATKFGYQLQTATKNMQKASGGPIVKKVLTDAKDKIKGITSSEEKKICLYSGHEFNIAHTLVALKSYKPHVPAYASHIIFELHKHETKYGFKIYYQDTKQEEPKLLNIPGCDELCPVEKFEQIMQDVIPDSSFKC